MSRRILLQQLLVFAMIIVSLFVSGTTFAQNNRDGAFERVKEVQERHTDELMAKPGVVGTAIGTGQGAQPIMLVLVEHGAVPEIPEQLEGVPVRPLVTGTIYALKPPGGSPPGQDKKPPPESAPPTAPTDLIAAEFSTAQVDLTWSDNADNEKGFEIEREIAGAFTLIDTVGSNVTFYSDTGLASSTVYTYRVRAYNDAGYSAYSNEASATTPGGSNDLPIGPRPAPIGVSTGHPHITAGTLGCRVADGSNVFALSNNHVYANENLAGSNDAVIQPGTYDGGSSPRDDIGTLVDFEPIEFSTSATNVIDAAIALTSTAEVGKSTALDGYGTPKSIPIAPDVDMWVMKYGRTTGQTKGRIWAINATVNVGYDSGVARFVEQIVVGGGGFSSGGDSGSLVVVEKGSDARRPVGLLFAGGSNATIANPIDAVLSRFGVTIDGE